MTSQLAVHRVSAADTERVTEIITLAFAHDPLWAHAMARAPMEGRRITPSSGALFIEGALRYPDHLADQPGRGGLHLDPAR